MKNSIKITLFFLLFLLPPAAVSSIQNTSSGHITPVIAYLLSDTINIDTDNDGVLDIDDQWPTDSSKPILSSLWGAYGEQWDPSGRLPFVAMAGHRDGTPVPDITRIVANVINFGATDGAGSSDDTQAFLDAINYAQSLVDGNNHGVIYVPEGIYEVSQQLHLNQSGMILRGAGRDKTEIRFINHSDGESRGIKLGGNQDASGSNKGGLNWQHNKWNTDFSTCLDNDNLPTRGDFVLHLEQPMTNAFKNNITTQSNRVRIAQRVHRQDGGSTPELMEQIYGGPSLLSEATGQTFILQEFIVSIIDNTTLKMDRPLRFTPTAEALFGQYACVSLRDTSVSWETEELGLEDFTLRYETSEFIGHNGVGKEGIQIHASHSWVKNIRVENADNAITNQPGTAHNQITDVIIDADRQTATYGPGIPYWYQVSGHVGLSAYGNDHLIDNFKLNTSFIHDVSMKESQGCVVTNGEADQMNMDHHRQVIYSNVWTHLNLGSAHRMWDSTGDGPEGFQAAALNTFWNITSDTANVEEEKPVWPADGNWIRGTNNWGYYKQNYVAIKGLDQKPQPGSFLDGEPFFDRNDIHLETIDTQYLWPQNIYEAQRSAYQKNKLW